MNSFPSPILFKRDFFYFLQSPPQKTSDTIIVFLGWFPRFLLVPSVPRPFLSMCLFSVCFVSFVRLFVNLCARLLKLTSVQYVRFAYTHMRVYEYMRLSLHAHKSICACPRLPPPPPPSLLPALTNKSPRRCCPCCSPSAVSRRLHSCCAQASPERNP